MKKSSQVATQEEYYQETAGSYDQAWKRENSNHFYKIHQIAETLFQHVTKKEARILEVGAGTGIHASYLLQNYRPRIEKLVLSDLSEPMLEEAKKRLGQQVDYHVSPAETLDLPPVFDAVFMSGSMHHFGNPAESVTRIHRLLKPGGVVIVCEPNVWNPLNFVRACSTGVDWGQFKVTKRYVSRLLSHNGFDPLENRVLHWKGPSPLSHTLWPYHAFEHVPALNPLAIMFLVAARKTR